MSLPPQLRALKSKLEQSASYSRKGNQNELLQELTRINELLNELEKTDISVLRKNLGESVYSSTRMTSPGGSCPCCGR